MVEIDGAQGEGGGQIFRSALTLSLCLQRAVRIVNIRAGRPKPGLLRQHLTCLRAAQAISDAEVSGAEIGSTEVVFKPGAVRAGDYRFDVGSAGSTSLVFQTVLLPLCFAAEASRLQLTGGTHNGHAPSYDYLHECFLPVFCRMGYRLSTELSEHGFYPAGGGRWRAEIQPVNGLQPLDLRQRGALQTQTAWAISSRLPAHVNERELAQVQKRLHWPESLCHKRSVASAGPGNIVSLRTQHEQITEVIEVVGEKRLTAERVAGRAVKAMKDYLASAAPVGEYLADQLLLPLALGRGGQFCATTLSPHFMSNKAVIEAFLALDIAVQPVPRGAWQVRVAGYADRG